MWSGFIFVCLLLHVMQLLVISSEGNELIMCASLHYAALMENAYLIGVTNGGERCAMATVVRVFISL